MMVTVVRVAGTDHTMAITGLTQVMTDVRVDGMGHT